MILALLYILDVQGGGEGGGGAVNLPPLTWTHNLGLTYEIFCRVRLTCLNDHFDVLTETDHCICIINYS